MADHTITITNSLAVLGGPPSLWGTMVWGTDFWGAGSVDTIQSVGKTVANTITVSSTMALATAKTIENSLAVTSDVTTIVLSTGVWNYVFQGGVINSDTRTTTEYAAITDQASTYTTPSTPSTVWS